MAEESVNDSFPDLTELENKIGMKTPESLLIWMRDAAHCEDSWSSDVDERRDRNAVINDSFSEKIRNLKLEMGWLRSADVRILRQLVAVHEGIEALRWLSEERGTLASRGSSLTSSQSSLVTAGAHGPSVSPYRENSSPICLQDSNDTPEGEESPDPALDPDDALRHTSYFHMLSSDSAEGRPPSPPGSKSEVSCSTWGRQGQAWSSTSPASASSPAPANPTKLQPQVSIAASVQDFKTSAEPIGRALVRSNRKGLKRDGGGSASPKQTEETQTHRELPTESLQGAREDSTKEEEQSVPSREEVLLGYDAQWRWVESQDDVTFL